MEAAYSIFEIAESAARIREVLDGNVESYTDRNRVPSRDGLTFDNGFYVDVSVIFVDMRGSSALAETYHTPTIAKLYRTYASELVAVLRGDENVKEVNIEGDCVWSVYDTSTKEDVQRVFNRGSWTKSVIQLINHELVRAGISPIRVGIGVADGRALMIKAGYKGAAVNDIIWTGSVVAEAAKLCSYANRTDVDKGMMISDVVYRNLTDYQKRLLEWTSTRNARHGDVISTAAREWFDSYKQTQH